MSKNNHWAIFLSNTADKDLFIKMILDKKITGNLSVFNSLTGILFSDVLINEIIEEESIRDYFIVAERSLRTYSAGEKKKVLLNYCLSKKTDYIIFDNPFDNLDITALVEFKQILSQLSTQVNIIQLINRSDDVLPFITNAVSIDDDNTLQYQISVEDYLKKKMDHPIAFNGSLPLPLHDIRLKYDTLIEFLDVNVSYDDRPILKNINWKIKPGEFWQLKGPNGSGKTTMLSMITGDNVKGYGQNLLMFGKRKGTGETVWEIKEKIGYFTSSMTELFSRRNTLEEMILSGFFDSVGLYIVPSELQIKIADEWLMLINMFHLKNKIFNRLTAGQQRIALIVRAMIKHPPLLILDEPTAGLDDDNVILVNKLINKISEESNTTVLYVSHRIEAGLEPRSIYSLTPDQNGSVGEVMK